MDDVKTKVCRKCGEEKPLDEFPIYKNNFQKGFRHKCKYCCAQEHKAWVKKNSEHVKKYAKKYRDKNKEYIRVYAKQYYYKHKNRINETQKKYKNKNRDKRNMWQRPYAREYYKVNRKRITSRINNARQVERDALKDAYIKKCLMEYEKISKEDINPTLIEFKRSQLELFRAVKEAKNTINSAC